MRLADGDIFERDDMTRVRIAAMTIFLSGAVVDTCAAEQLILRGVNVFDVTSGELLVDRAIVIEGDRIVSVSPDAKLKSQVDDTVLNFTGRTVIPGLIDLHSHLLLHPYDEASWNDQVLKESIGLRTLRAVPAMKKTLEAGFTTLRDLGTEGAGYADVALRDAVRAGIVEGPRIFAVTRAIVATGCYGPSGFDPRWSLPKGGQVADGPTEVRRVVREQIAAGADWIKVYADYRRKLGDASTPTFSQEELVAIVDEAKSAGLSVAAHAGTSEAIRRAVLAGVSTIEHGTNASSEVLSLMQEHNVVLCPTLAAAEAMATYRGLIPGEADHPRLVAVRAMFKRALDSGVTIACGSDVGVFSHGDNARELELMVKFGMTPKQALQSATTTAPQVLGRREELGQVATGFLADLVVLESDPSKNITRIRNPILVMKGGRIVHRRTP